MNLTVVPSTQTRSLWFYRSIARLDPWFGHDYSVVSWACAGSVLGITTGRLRHISEPSKDNVFLRQLVEWVVDIMQVTSYLLLVMGLLSLIVALLSLFARRNYKMVRIERRVLKMWRVELQAQGMQPYMRKATRWVARRQPDKLINQNLAWQSKGYYFSQQALIRMALAALVREYKQANNAG